MELPPVRMAACGDPCRGSLPFCLTTKSFNYNKGRAGRLCWCKKLSSRTLTLLAQVRCHAEFWPGRPQPQIAPFQLSPEQVRRHVLGMGWTLEQDASLQWPARFPTCLLTCVARCTPFVMHCVWEQAKQEFLMWQRRLAPGDLLRPGSFELKAGMLPFWLFSVRAGVEYRGSVGRTDRCGVVWCGVVWLGAALQGMPDCGFGLAVEPCWFVTVVSLQLHMYVLCIMCGGRSSPPAVMER